MTASARTRPDRLLLGLCWATLLWAVLVLQAGGFTTSIQAGMAFLDWPLSNGSVNPPGWLTEIDKFAEHSHRLAATTSEKSAAPLTRCTVRTCGFCGS